MMKLWIVDAFSDRPFAGNPAAVCYVEDEPDTEWMQSVAMELNLSETAFVQQRDDHYQLRWFTPAVEVDLCGHATLAAAHALWSASIADSRRPIRFQSRSGLLTCTQEGDRILLDFPATPAEEVTPPAGLVEALGVEPSFVGSSQFDKLLVVESEQVVRSLTPDFVRLVELDMRGVIVTSRSSEPRFDFISRYFAPAAGIDEDPVTGSAHCCLAPYWGKQLGKSQMTGFQASKRGGVVHVELQNDRVILGGQAVTMVEGKIVCPPTAS